jgi:two-component system, chemotaxis family, response regulator WspF
VRIAIVNDMTTAAEALRRVILSVPGYQLAWIARNGAEAVEKCRQDTPDLILMDLIMPVMDGVEATRRIMAGTPCPILVVTSAVTTNSAKVFEALGLGALDAVQTPILIGEGAKASASALKFKIDRIGRGAMEDKGRARPRKNTPEEPQSGFASDRLVAIGASAGGPAALATILGGLPRDFPAAIVIVQHVDAEFVSLMADWLNQASALPVRIARQGDRPEAGTALIAGTNDHLVFLNPYELGYIPEPRECHYRPSIDVFFESVVRHWNGRSAGVVLTGMGRDGANGLKAMREAGSPTIAQNAATSVVYGMPKAAAELGAAANILPIDEIAGRLMGIFPVSTAKGNR